jgi:hypothetical protein
MTEASGMTEPETQPSAVDETSAAVAARKSAAQSVSIDLTADSDEEAQANNSSPASGRARGHVQGTGIGNGSARSPTTSTRENFAGPSWKDNVPHLAGKKHEFRVWQPGAMSIANGSRAEVGADGHNGQSHTHEGRHDKQLVCHRCAKCGEWSCPTAYGTRARIHIVLSIKDDAQLAPHIFSAEISSKREWQRERQRRWPARLLSSPGRSRFRRIHVVRNRPDEYPNTDPATCEQS